MPGYDGVMHWGYGGDFEDPIHDSQFCINGLTFPDRTPHPTVAEIRHLQAPLQIQIDTIQAASGTEGSGADVKVSVQNGHDFESLQHLRLEARLLANGVVVPLDGSERSTAASVHVRPPADAAHASMPQMRRACSSSWWLSAKRARGNPI